jgi:hypothetical protein
MRKKHLSPTKKKKKKRKITKRNGMFEASTAEYIYIASKKKQKQSVIQLLANYSMKLLRSSSIGDPN